MSEIDGGPAFPVECHWDANGPMCGIQTGNAEGWATGMTLRDYFAAKAMQMRFGRRGTSIDVAEMADHCYRMADAMLRARSSTQQAGGES